MNNQQILARMRYNPECDEEFLEDQEKDWLSVAWWENKCEILRIRESQDEPKKRRVKNTLTHTNFFMLMKSMQSYDEVKELCPPEALNDYFNLHNVLVYNTLLNFLKLTRI